MGRDVFELGGGYRFCLKIDTVDAGFAPLRVAIVLDKSYSMCQNPRAGICCVDGIDSDSCMMNDPTDKRVVGAQAFVDSLAAKSPKSEVGVVTYDQNALSHNPIPLNTPANIQQVKEWIYEASCIATGFDKPATTITRRDTTVDTPTTTPAPGGLGKTSATKATYLGLGLQSGLSVVDYNFSAMDSVMKRHVILLTDGAWDDASTLNRAPATLINNYTARNPGREVPVIHGVFLSNAALHVRNGFSPEGCSNEDPVILDNLQQATTLGATAGSYFPGSTPETIVQNFDSLLNRMVSFEPQQLVSMTVTNTTNGQVRQQQTIASMENVADTVNFQATIDNLPLVFGLNTLTVQWVVNKPGTEIKDTMTSTVSVFRTDAWTTQINPKEYDIYCVEDSTYINISVTPSMVPVNTPFNVNSTIHLKEKFILDTVQVRVFTQFPDADPFTVAVFHFERNLMSTGGTEGAGSFYDFTETDALFGKSVLSQGSFSTGIGNLAGDFALEAWIRPSNAGGKTDIFSVSGVTFGIGADRLLYLTANDAEITKAVVPVDANTWSHVAVSRINGYVRIFINGVDVSNPVEFTASLMGTMTVSCPQGGLLDEVRISNTSRLRPDPNFFRLDIPSLQQPIWTVGVNSLTQPFLVLSPDMWTDGNIQFQVTSPIPGKLVVNFQHKGTLETQWSKNSNVVFAAGDLQGPYITKATFINGLIGDIYDTLFVEFSEPVLCDSLKSNPEPIASFQVYGPDTVLKTYVLKPKVFEDAYYTDNEACTEKYVQKATIVTIASIDGIVPKRDSIVLVGSAVDTAGNYPDTTRRK
ncbi:MAG: hypothetical protein JW913_12670, partial [Chitinispirillaceae bacterium]|nr:hypothetical protein [Chitinispirillaceae bacterium]